MYNISDLTVHEYLEKIAEPNFPGPASGSVAATTAAMAAALVEMSCLVSLKKREDKKLEEIVDKVRVLRNRCLILGNDDMEAMGKLIKSKKNPEIFQQQIKYATEPLIEIVKCSSFILEILEEVASLCIPQVLGDLAGSVYFADAALNAAQKGAEVNLNFIKEMDYKENTSKTLKEITSNCFLIREKIMDMLQQ